MSFRPALIPAAAPLNFPTRSGASRLGATACSACTPLSRVVLFKVPRGTNEQELVISEGRLVAASPVIGTLKQSVGFYFVDNGYIPLVISPLVRSPPPPSVLPVESLTVEVESMPLA